MIMVIMPVFTSLLSFTAADTIPEVVLAKIPKVNKTATAPCVNFLIANCDFVDLNMILLLIVQM